MSTPPSSRTPPTPGLVTAFFHNEVQRMMHSVIPLVDTLIDNSITMRDEEPTKHSQARWGADMLAEVNKLKDALCAFYETLQRKEQEFNGVSPTESTVVAEKKKGMGIANLVALMSNKNKQQPLDGSLSPMSLSPLGSFSVNNNKKATVVPNTPSAPQSARGGKKPTLMTSRGPLSGRKPVASLDPDVLMSPRAGGGTALLSTQHALSSHHPSERAQRLASNQNVRVSANPAFQRASTVSEGLYMLLDSLQRSVRAAHAEILMPAVPGDFSDLRCFCATGFGPDTNLNDHRCRDPTSAQVLCATSKLMITCSSGRMPAVTEAAERALVRESLQESAAPLASTASQGSSSRSKLNRKQWSSISIPVRSSTSATPIAVLHVVNKDNGQANFNTEDEHILFGGSCALYHLLERHENLELLARHYNPAFPLPPVAKQLALRGGQAEMFSPRDAKNANGRHMYVYRTWDLAGKRDVKISLDDKQKVRLDERVPVVNVAFYIEKLQQAWYRAVILNADFQKTFQQRTNHLHQTFDRLKRAQMRVESLRAYVLKLENRPRSHFKDATTVRPPTQSVQRSDTNNSSSTTATPPITMTVKSPRLNGSGGGSPRGFALRSPTSITPSGSGAGFATTLPSSAQTAGNRGIGLDAIDDGWRKAVMALSAEERQRIREQQLGVNSEGMPLEDTTSLVTLGPTPRPPMLAKIEQQVAQREKAAQAAEAAEGEDEVDEWDDEGLIRKVEEEDRAFKARMHQQYVDNHPDEFRDGVDDGGDGDDDGDSGAPPAHLSLTAIEAIEDEDA